LAIVRRSQGPLGAPRRPGRLDRFPTRSRARCARGSDLVASRCHLVALVGRDVSCHCGPQTSTGLLAAELRCVLSMTAAGFASLLVGALERFLIAGRLVLIRGRLFGVSGRLIGVRSRLVGIRCRLIDS